MDAPSITSTEAFQFRAQRSEEGRAALMGGIFAFLLLVTIVRRFVGGVVMSDNVVFASYAGILGASVTYESIVYAVVRRLSRLDRLVPAWRWKANAFVELAIPVALLTILHFRSPRGEYAGLSAPVILLLPIVIMVSVLRLRPAFTLWTGIGAAAAHAVLAAHTVAAADVPSDDIPVLFAYGPVLALTGVAGSLVARAARQYVAEAVEEATARERAALRLANIERDLEVAREIQAGLLPAASPRFSGFDIAGMNRAAEQTGGDYYDWQELPDGRLIVIMADVTGHGIGPAIVMAVCRAYSRASAPMGNAPVFLLNRLNSLLHSDLRGGRFITLATALLDRAGGVELLSAGHGPTLVFHAADRRIEEFGGDGLPLAIDPAERYGPTRTFTMERDDLVVMLTDGVIEWRNQAGEQFGLTRLSEIVARAAPQPAAQIVDSVYRAVLDFAGAAPQLDDVTLVVIKRSA